MVSDWPQGILAEDVRPQMLALAGAGQPFALATIVAAEGGPRSVGSQMVIGADAWWGFLSGGCIEADVVLHGREVLASREPRTLIYGRGSPFIDMRLPCGGRIEVLLERIEADDPALAFLRELGNQRRPALWSSDGRNRRCEPADDHAAGGCASEIHYTPVQRLYVVGSDPFAIAIAKQGRLLGWEAWLIQPSGPEEEPPHSLRYSRAAVADFLEGHGTDAWTAIAVATHDLDVDHVALLAALPSDAGYVGVLGSRKRIAERHSKLVAAGLSESILQRLHAPIGLPLGAATPREVGVAVAGEIIASRSPAI